MQKLARCVNTEACSLRQCRSLLVASMQKLARCVVKVGSDILDGCGEASAWCGGGGGGGGRLEGH